MSSTTIDGDLDVSGNFRVRGTMLPSLPRTALTQDDLQSFPVQLASCRIHDEFDRPLPDRATKSAMQVARFTWDPNVASTSFFVANRDFRVVGISARVDVLGTGGACTAVIRKAASGTATASGTALHSGSINLVGTAATNQTLTVSTTSSDLDIPSGTAICFHLTGTPTSARGTVCVYLVPISDDDFSLSSAAFGTGTPYLTTGDMKALGSTTRYARFKVQVPQNYVAGQTLALRFAAGMLTTVSDGTAVLNVECYKSNRDCTKTGSNLTPSGTVSINSLTFADKTFTLTTTTLSPGDWLDCRLYVTVSDSVSVTAVTAAIAEIDLLADVQG